MRRYRVFPWIGLISVILSRLDMLPLEFAIRPPLFAGAISPRGFREQLIAIVTQRCNVYAADLDRPKTPGAGFVPKIGRLVGGSDEHALPGLDHFLSAIARAVSLDRPRDERFEGFGLGAVHRRKLRDFDQPFSANMLGYFLIARHVGQAIRKPLASENCARHRLAGALLALQNEHVVALAPRLDNPRYHRDQEHPADGGYIYRLLGSEIV